MVPCANSLKMKFVLISITANMLMMASSVKAHLFTTAASAHEGRRMQLTCPVDSFGCLTTQFCGSDKQCHDLSCQEYFQMRGWNVESIGDTTLACEDYSNGDQDGRYAVVYGCSGYVNSVIPAGEAYGLPFNQKCSATIWMQLFECYDLKPKTDFSDFLSVVDSATSLTCTNTDGSERPPNFRYHVIYGSISPSHSDWVSVGQASTATFNESLTIFTMSAIVTNLTGTPSQSPTGAPTQGATLASQTSGVPSIRPSHATAALVGLMAFLI
jgi:hypothetical protein